ncbi:MAG TPA: oligopeptide/dipeptide ABC transporter ATP-binding protein, partial [Candidatus Limnocylindrales bacterium]|nr:oligopeptide/dipeptide ABC transporter ATP-binding protein [Candidatus Limnocylindrales bacterium]
MADQSANLLGVDRLTRSFSVRTGFGGRNHHVVQALQSVSFDVATGSTVAIVGESGCGKSTLARCVTRLIEPDEGTIVFDGIDITHLSRGALRPLRRQMAIVFQDPYTSLDPRMSVGDIVAEPLMIAGQISSADRDKRVRELLGLVGLRAADSRRYPYEFSGGQRQRIAIARAISTRPRLLVCDEPVSALDVSIQAQILNLLADLKAELGLTMVIISHNLEVVRHLADKVLVMYLGVLVEIGPTTSVFGTPAHPYSAALGASMLSPVPRGDGSEQGSVPRISGEPPSPLEPPSGCRFHPRCPIAIARCATEVPEATEIEPGHLTRCHLP